MTVVMGEDDGTGFGVKGSSTAPLAGTGVEGISDLGDGVFGQAKAEHKAAVRGYHTGHFESIALLGELDEGVAAVKGVVGGGSDVGADDLSGAGVWGDSASGPGVIGTTSIDEGVLGEGPIGVHGIGTSGSGVFGESAVADGVRGSSHSQQAGVTGANDNADGGPGIFGTSEHGEGVHGESHAAGDAAGVAGFAVNSDGFAPGVLGESSGSGPGVLGRVSDKDPISKGGDKPGSLKDLPASDVPRAGVVGVNELREGGPGVFGSSLDGEGVHGETSAARFLGAVTGLALNRDGVATGVYGESRGYAAGVTGNSLQDTGVFGFHGDVDAIKFGETTVLDDARTAGVFGATNAGPGVIGYSRDQNSPAVYAYGLLKAIALDKPLAASFEGNVQVDGDIQVNGDIFVTGADFAEQFDIAGDQQIQRGSVVVIDQDGRLQMSNEAYDRRVAGVVAGAGQYRPGIVLDGNLASGSRISLALVGKVYCRVDAQYAAIEVGDLLTSSPTPGHAMKAADPLRAFGAVIGKALRPWRDGGGLIPILVALQ